jgi:hypothetical protein
VVRVNINGGWLVDLTVDRQYLTYGVGVDWRTPDNVWTLTAEVFGQDVEYRGPCQRCTAALPAWLALASIDRWNADIIYGRNITGNGGNWLTLATVFRFPRKTTNRISAPSIYDANGPVYDVPSRVDLNICDEIVAKSKFNIFHLAEGAGRNSGVKLQQAWFKNAFGSELHITVQV